MSIIIRTFCYFILMITLLLSVFLLLRGHNNPGGGFIGALVACTCVGFYIIAFDISPAAFYRKAIILLSMGVFCLLASIFVALVIHNPPLTGLWLNIDIFNTPVKLGTPLLFDFGIYFSILGSLIWVLSSLEGGSDD